MTVSTEDNSVQYSTNGSTVTFSVPYYFIQNADLLVTYTNSSGVETTLSLGSGDYSVTGAGNPSGGSITVATTYPTGGLITIDNEPAALQPTDYTETDPFPAATHERALDRGILVAQRALRLGQRALKFPVSDTASTAIPRSSTRASRVLGFDILGNVTTYANDSAVTKAENVTADDGASGTLWTTVQGAITWFKAKVDKLASSTGSEIVGLTPAFSGTPTTFDIWVKQQVAIAENYPTVQDALNSGAPIVKLSKASYTFSSGVNIPSGVTLEGNGKSYTNIICSSNITPFTMLNANDAGLEGVLITAHSTQTNQLILLDAAASTMARCRIRDVQGSGSATDFPFISIRTRNGAYGSWAHLIEDVSVSGCGTILRAESQFAGSWINSVQMSHVYANDFIRGMHLIATAGDGASDMTFFDWATQTSARTQFGALIADVATQGTNRKNSFTDVRFYDLPSSALSYYIGNNVLDTTINGLSVDDPTPSRIKDTGINTQINGQSVFDYFARNGRMVTLPTGAGLTASTSGTATTQSLSNYAQLRTGATAGSIARLYSTDVIAGLSKNQIFNIDFGLPLRITFTLTRITSGASALGRVQIKQTQADGALLASGLGLQINNYGIFGETYGTSIDTLNAGTITDGQPAKIEIIHYPANRVEWWVDGVLKTTETTAAKIPVGQAPCYLQVSLNNGTAVDVQMFVNSISLQAGI